MGGGVSLIEGVEELMTTTMLIGRAISAMSFPGMYRLYDFHSKKAPKLKNARQFTFFAPDSDDEDGSGNSAKEENEPDPSTYAHFFKVTVNGDDIYLENPTEANEAGWTPLHTCCMSMATVSAGIALIDETLRLGGDLEAKTLFGPGTFNKGWTALQMACGYGIDALVQRLVEAGADVNAINCFGYSCIHEACHRGFQEVVKHLLASQRVNLSYIPPDELAAGSPFASAPCQAPLAEAARCGFHKIVQQLLDAQAPKNLANQLGWTALHEACFYHRIETVKTLLLAGCDPTIRTARGALPYHLAGLPEIKQMLRNMGGDAAVPANDEDVVDMIQILTDLTLATEFSSNCRHQQPITHSNQRALKNKDAKDNNNDEDDGGNNAEDDEDEEERQMLNMVLSSGSHTMPVIIISGGRQMMQPSGSNTHNHANTNNNERHNIVHLTENSHHNSSDDKASVPAAASSSSSSGTAVKPKPTAAAAKASPAGAAAASSSSSSSSSSSLLHSGGILGELPALHHTTNNTVMAADPKDVVRPKGKVTASAAPVLSDATAVPKDTPKQYLCQLTHKLMSEPMKTIYGNIYDKTAIFSWFAQQGRICPLTGMPLAEIDLSPMVDLGNEIRNWILKRSIGATTLLDDSSNHDAKESGGASNTKKSPLKSKMAAASSSANNDDLYDF